MFSLQYMHHLKSAKAIRGLLLPSCWCEVAVLALSQPLFTSYSQFMVIR